MPYETLPQRLRDIIPDKAAQELFRAVVNRQLAAGKTEAVAIASAWARLQRAGYDKGEDGKWTAKTMPTASQVHVDGAEWDDEEKGKKPKDHYKTEDIDKQTYQPPEAARNNARRVLEWKEKYGNEVKGMTDVGWARARQLASGKPVSRDTVARMSAFNRHRQNAEVAQEYKSTPWKDRGYVAWLGWGGTTGVDWARRIMSSIAKRMMNDDSFTMSAEAAVRSMELGLNGEVHVHQTADGQAVYMPGASHKAYLERMAELAGIDEPDDGETPDSGESRQDLLERVISAIMSAAMTYDMNKTSDILKLDSERRIAWGWASVSTVNGKLVTDTQGDVITPTEMGKMADRFMSSARMAKAMHEGEQIGEVLHSLPLTAELAKAFGMETDREGWIIGMKVHDDAIWKGFQEGRYKAFSIGGKGRRKPK
jgi:cation transport regulator ChaB